MKTSLIENCRLYNAPEDAPEISVLVKDGKIATLDPSGSETNADHVIQAEGRILAPDLIDVHIQG